MENQDLQSETEQAGAKPSLIEYFGIEGLFGYRSVSLTSKYAATILIAKNGAGKTTLLGAMDAFLKCQFARLSELHFSRIECRLRGLPDLLVLKKSDVDEIMQIVDNNELQRIAKLNGLDVSEVLHFIVGDYPAIKSDTAALRENQIFRKVYLQSAHTISTTKALFDQLEKLIVGSNSQIELIRKGVQSVLSDTEIVYLPTYRRIELSLPEVEESLPGRRVPSVQSRLGLNRRGLQTGDIQFGLGDISERLSKLNQDILAESNQGYREISANIINDLMNGDFEKESPSLEERPSKEALVLFFSRLKEGVRYVGPYLDFKIPDLDRIYSEESIPENSRKFLTYFLGKLNTVMQKTRDVEGVVEEFVKNCNRYLSVQDESVEIPRNSYRQALYDDSKVLKLDRKNLRVTVSSLNESRKIPLDSLSSGEQQMISLFARLYLYPKKKILLIDEPELSLSLDWQRKILVDMVNAPSSEQVIAITHSPFVFDNALEPFAIPLKLKIDSQVGDILTGSEEDEVNE